MSDEIRPTTNRDVLVHASQGGRAPSDWTKEDYVESETERIVSGALMALVAAQMPRRAGGEASARALSRDKKVSRRVAQTYLDLWNRLNLKREAPHCPDWGHAFLMASQDDEARRSGATVLWPKWLKERSAWIPKQRRRVAAFALREGFVSWGARRVILLDAEARGIDRALKTAVPTKEEEQDAA